MKKMFIAGLILLSILACVVAGAEDLTADRNNLIELENGMIGYLANDGGDYGCHSSYGKAEGGFLEFTKSGYLKYHAPPADCREGNWWKIKAKEAK